MSYYKKLASKLDNIAEKLEKNGYVDLAYEIDKVSNTIEKLAVGGGGLEFFSGPGRPSLMHQKPTRAQFDIIDRLNEKTNDKPRLLRELQNIPVEKLVSLVEEYPRWMWEYTSSGNTEIREVTNNPTGGPENIYGLIADFIVNASHEVYTYINEVLPDVVETIGAGDVDISFFDKYVSNLPQDVKSAQKMFSDVEKAIAQHKDTRWHRLAGWQITQFNNMKKLSNVLAHLPAVRFK